MGNQQIPKIFNWVKARAECSLPNMFIALREVVDSDIKEMAPRIRSADSDETVVMTQITETKFIVARQRNMGRTVEGDSTVFERTADSVVVKNGRSLEQILTAIPSLTPAGECKFSVDGLNGEPLELWQVSQRALEKLFFS